MSAESQFRNPATRVKINPETYVKFDGTETILMKNLHSQEGISIKYDIMLILYDLVNWRTVGELVAPWPPDDQEKIYQHLEMLHAGRILITSDTEVEEEIESGLSDFLGHNIHINVENHHAMLRDYVRMAAYRRAIERKVKPDTIAMDLGCGSGILSFFAVMAGVKKIFSIERRSDIILLASELAKANGFADRIEFIEGSSSRIRESQIDPKPNLFIAEILGNGILEENVLEFTLDARDRFLAPGADMIPWKLDIYIFGYDSGMRQSKAQEVKEFKELYGVDFDLLGQVLCSKATTRMERYSTAANKTMTDPVMTRSLDFRTLKETTFVDNFDLVALEDGEITSFCGYFKAWLDEETVLTNSPWAPPTHWTNLVYTLAEPRKVKKGDRIPMEIIYDGALRVRPL